MTINLLMVLRSTKILIAKSLARGKRPLWTGNWRPQLTSKSTFRSRVSSNMAARVVKMTTRLMSARTKSNLTILWRTFVSTAPASEKWSSIMRRESKNWFKSPKSKWKRRTTSTRIFWWRMIKWALRIRRTTWNFRLLKRSWPLKKCGTLSLKRNSNLYTFLLLTCHRLIKL